MLRYLTLLLLGGCSFFISKIDSPLVDEKNYLANLPEHATFCPLENKSNLQLVGSTLQSQDIYFSLIQNLKGQRLDFLDHFALWTLAQLSIRPDQASATSRLQILFHQGNKTQYVDFFSEDPQDQYPYFYGIEWLLRKYGKKTRLETYASLLQNHLVSKIMVSKELEQFLLQNQEAIKANPVLAPFFFRGTEVLKENERTPELNYPALIALYRKAEKNQKIIVNTSLTPFSTGPGGASKGSCNYDFNLYDNSIFLIDKVIPVANIFGLSEGGSTFMASSSQRLDAMDSLHGHPLFKGLSKVRSSAVCVMEDETNKVWTFSNQSRDPGQHLFHLIRYGLARTKSTFEVDKLIRHSRHLFLSDPVRLIIEANRSRPDQIENLLKLNLPIYNADKLGNIWAHTTFNGESRFIIDDRNPGAYLCK